ncbi:hypothetical protein B0H16DRAFT_1666610 [Mycena metata]|uniref:Reverse transcriptase zinc-binding domain-containing protein n=1 Tax=Mycena metata TaxID=1033252 RepID=A0AAD7HF02_9AGAR|nr:hypothetical protein B0H16DRAFT_1666610 [Mycena metata]
MLLAVQRAPRDQKIRITSSKNTARIAMTKNLESLEDRGWVGVAEHRPLRALAAELRARTAETIFVDAAEEGGPESNRGKAEAMRLAKENLQTREYAKLSLAVDPDLAVPGIKLSKLTQRLAYAGIKDQRKAVSRKATDNNVKQIKDAVQTNFKRQPTTAQVWTSIRHRDLTRQVKNFLWKSLHSAHRIGNFWKHIPECEDRAICQHCDEPEDLEHILLKCRRPGQSQIWSLAKDLWLKKHPTWPDLSLGSLLGCGLASFSEDNGHPLPGSSRLYRILVSESMFMIWKIRNSCVITRNGEPLPETEIHNKWLYAINQRLKFDCALTNYAKFGKQNSIKSSLVIQTWKSTLMDEDKLPENWTRAPRVLVGTEPKSSPHPPQPSGRRGRNR